MVKNDHLHPTGGTGAHGSYGAQVATISTIVARLLSAASAADRKAIRERGFSMGFRGNWGIHLGKL